MKEEKKLVWPVTLTCNKCEEVFMGFDSKNAVRIPKIEDQPCPYCLVSQSGKKMDVKR